MRVLVSEVEPVENHQGGHVKMNPWARHRARRLVLQALYQWQLSGTEIIDLTRQFAEADGVKKVDFAFFQELVAGVIARHEDLDAVLAPYLDRAVSALDEVERAALRLGAFELQHRVDVPAKVAIDEAVGLAQSFGAMGSHSYVNGVLDRLARVVRAEEMGLLGTELRSEPDGSTR